MAVAKLFSMTKVLVAHSQVKDGSMANREDARDKQVMTNRHTWLLGLGIDESNTYRVALTFEQNGDYCRYRTISENDIPANTFDAPNKAADALVTTQVNQALFLPLADCIGAVLFDEEHGVLMMSHLGRHSLEQNGGVRSVEYLTQHYQTDPKNLKIWLSAAISKDTYKIFALHNKGLKEVLYEQFAKAGVDIGNINDNTDDTGSNPQYYSHSEFLKGNKPDNGRHAIVAMMTE